MKAHKFKTKLTTQEEVWDEFNSELRIKLDRAMYDSVGIGQGVLAYAKWTSSEEGIKKCAAIKLDLVKEWQRRGRNMAFLKNRFQFDFMNLLSEKYFGKELK
jgi:hypothetical protein